MVFALAGDSTITRRVPPAPPAPAVVPSVPPPDAPWLRFASPFLAGTVLQPRCLVLLRQYCSMVPGGARCCWVLLSWSSVPLGDTQCRLVIVGAAQVVRFVRVSYVVSSVRRVRLRPHGADAVAAGDITL